MTKNLTIALGMLALTACFDAEKGERMRGECPADEVCSELTPDGLSFSTAYSLLDSTVETVGPVALGGRLSVSYSALTGELKEVVATADGALELPDTGSTRVLGAKVGDGLLRIVDPTRDELYDRIRLEVLPIDRVELEIVNDIDRTYLRAGCDEGVRIVLIHDGVDGPVRVFDDSMSITRPNLIPVTGMTTVNVSDTGLVTALELEAGDATFSVEMEVREEACPAD